MNKDKKKISPSFALSKKIMKRLKEKREKQLKEKK